MQRPSTHTAILIFARSAAAEGRAKRLLDGAHAHTNQRLWQHFNRKIIAQTRHTPAQVVWLDEQQQQGDTFSERFTGAVAQLFAEGFERVIAIGNDSPNLSAVALNTALRALDQHPLVLGPATDGGDYLIGIQRAFFAEHWFEALPWTTAQLHAAFLALAKANSWSVHCLPSLSDIDRLADLRPFLAQLPAKLQSLIHSALHLIYTLICVATIWWLNKDYVHSIAVRGPPARIVIA